MNKFASLAALSLFSFIFIFASIAGAQLGEVAGQPHFNVSINGQNSITITVVSQASSPLPVKVILPSLVSKDANAITPRVTANPMEGDVPPGGDLHINVTVYMPGGTNKPGYTWSGIMQVVTEPNTSNSSSGGAVIIEGVAKIVTVTALAPVSNIWDILIPIIIIAVIVVAVAIVVVLARRKGMLGGHAVAAARSKSGARKKGSKASAKRTTRPRKGTARRRKGKKGSGKAGRKGRKTTRRRRRT